jgi:hypothetical protein
MGHCPRFRRIKMALTTREMRELNDVLDRWDRFNEPKERGDITRKQIAKEEIFGNRYDRGIIAREEDRRDRDFIDERAKATDERIRQELAAAKAAPPEETVANLNRSPDSTSTRQRQAALDAQGRAKKQEDLKTEYLQKTFTMKVWNELVTEAMKTMPGLGRSDVARHLNNDNNIQGWRMAGLNPPPVSPAPESVIGASQLSRADRAVREQQIQVQYRARQLGNTQEANQATAIARMMDGGRTRIEAMRMLGIVRGRTGGDVSFDPRTGASSQQQAAEQQAAQQQVAQAQQQAAQAAQAQQQTAQAAQAQQQATQTQQQATQAQQPDERLPALTMFQPASGTGSPTRLSDTFQASFFGEEPALALNTSIAQSGLGPRQQQHLRNRSGDFLNRFQAELGKQVDAGDVPDLNPKSFFDNMKLEREYSMIAPSQRGFFSRQFAPQMRSLFNY